MTNPHDALKLALEALHVARDYVELQNQAEGLTEGFSGRKRRPSDNDLRFIDETIAALSQHKAEQESETEAWLIEWHDTHGHRKKVYRHNAVADYRAIYEDVTVTELVRRGSQQPAQEISDEEILTLAKKHGMPTVTLPGNFPWAYIDPLLDFSRALLSRAQQKTFYYAFSDGLYSDYGVNGLYACGHKVTEEEWDEHCQEYENNRECKFKLLKTLKDKQDWLIKNNPDKSFQEKHGMKKIDYAEFWRDT